MRSVAYCVLVLTLLGCINRTSQALDQALIPYMWVPATADCEGADCADMWQRAQVWVAKHSKWKLQTATDVLLQTYSPATADVSYSFNILKEPTGAGRYSIRMGMSCGNIFGCSPSQDQVRRAFIYYVMKGKDLLDQFSGYGLGAIH
jgi:hypothetical protein